MIATWSSRSSSTELNKSNDATPTPSSSSSCRRARAAREERLRTRGDDEASMRRRLEVGQEEERLGRQIADYVVVNDDVDRAAKEVAGILDHKYSAS